MKNISYQYKNKGSIISLRVTSEERQVIKDEFLADNEEAISIYSKTLIEYCQSKTLKSDLSIIDSIFPSLEKIEKIAGNILFVLATTEAGSKPLQTIAGQFSPSISISDLYTDRKNAMHTAMEILMISQPFTKFSWSNNGYPMIESLIYDEEITTKNIHLPLTRPTDQNEELGSFNWKLNHDSDAAYAFHKLNHTALRVVQLDEVPEPVPKENDYSKDANKQRELCNKQLGRKFLAKEYANKPIYFNWSSDYRGRMYSVGYYINCQGNEVEKNMIELAKGETLTFQGIQQLKKSIASAYGLDKKTDEEKLAWFIKNKSVLHLRTKNAKEPYTFQSLIKAWKDHNQGKQIHAMAELDSTQSQAQVLSVLLHKKEIAITCNLVQAYNNKSEPVQNDLYQLVADRMSDILANKGK